MSRPDGISDLFLRVKTLGVNVHVSANVEWQRDIGVDCSDRQLIISANRAL
jgi:hypothetical protein